MINNLEVTAIKAINTINNIMPSIAANTISYYGRSGTGRLPSRRNHAASSTGGSPSGQSLTSNAEARAAALARRSRLAAAKQAVEKAAKAVKQATEKVGKPRSAAR